MTRRRKAEAPAAHPTSPAPVPSAEKVLVSPDLAREWLEKYNQRNRPLREAVVDRYAEQMKSDEWQETGDTVKFGADGLLYDGQHRLSAVVRSGRTVTLWVVRGLASSAREAIDMGEARRAFDNLAITDGLSVSPEDRTWLTAIARHVYGVHHKLTVSVARAVLAAYGPGLKIAREVFKGHQRGLCRASYVGAFIFAYRKEGEPVAELMRRFRDGANLDAKDPILLLRNSMMTTSSGGYVVGHAEFERTCAAVAAALDGEKRARLIRSAAALERFRVPNDTCLATAKEESVTLEGLIKSYGEVCVRAALDAKDVLTDRQKEVLREVLSGKDTTSIRVQDGVSRQDIFKVRRAALRNLHKHLSAQG